MPDPTYPPKPEPRPTMTASAIGWNNALAACSTHYDPQITALKARIAELEGVLGELMEACGFDGVEMALAGNPRVIERASEGFAAAVAAAQATLEPTTSGEKK